MRSVSFSVIKVSLSILAALLLWVESATAKDWYVAAHGGLNVAFDNDVEELLVIWGTDKIGEADFENGFVAGGAVGFRSSGAARFELEATYRRNDFDDIDWTESIKAGTFDTDGEVTSWSFMLNAYGDIDTGTALTPYLGAGLGAAYFSLDDVSDSDGLLLDDDDLGFAAQLGAGLGYAVTETVTVSFDYRLFYSYVSADVPLSQPGIGGETLFLEYLNHSIMLGLRYQF